MAVGMFIIGPPVISFGGLLWISYAGLGEGIVCVPCFTRQRSVLVLLNRRRLIVGG